MTRKEMIQQAPNKYAADLEHPHASQILDILHVAGSVKDRRTLDALVFVAQAFGATETNYSFGSSDAELLAPVSAELGYNIHMMEQVGIIIDTRDNHSLRISETFRDLAEGHDSRSILNRRILDELLSIEPEELMRFAKYWNLHQMLDGKLTEGEIGQRAKSNLRLSDELIRQFIDKSKLLDELATEGE